MHRPSAIRVAARYMTAAVKVEVLDRETEKARERFGQGIALGRFKSPIKLYRVLDGEELREVLSTGEIKGGDYSVPGEREYGAQWGADKAQVSQWGERQRGARLGHDLFVAEIEGNDRVFAHLTGGGGQMNPGVGTIDLDLDLCSTGLGCSIPVQSNSVLNWYIVEDGAPRQVTVAELKEMLPRVGIKTRDLDIYKGVRFPRLPKKMEKALRWLILRDMPEFRKAQRERDIRTERALREEWGVTWGDGMDDDKLGKALIQRLCKQEGEECALWSTMYSKAEKDAGRLGGKTSFSVLVCLMDAHARATFREVDVFSIPPGMKVKFVEVRRPDGLWTRIWQPWGKTSIRFMGDRVVFR